MSQSKNEKVLQGRDLITIGIFSAIYFVINFAFMLMGGFHPLLWILMPGFIALCSGIPFMLMCNKVQKFGSVLLMGIITGLIYFATGQFTIVILVTFLIACISGELARGLSGYQNYWGNTIAFVCFSLGMTGSPLPIWLMRDQFFAQITEQGMSESYVTTLEAVSSTGMLIVLFMAPIIGAVIGSLITKKMFKKHFQKAGIV